MIVASLINQDDIMRWVMLIGLILWGGVVSSQAIPQLTPDTPIVVSVGAIAPTPVTFHARQASVITITSQATDEFNSVLWLISPSGHWIAYNDDAGSSDAIISQLILPESGIYTVYVDSFNGVSEGDVQITLSVDDLFAMQESGDGWDAYLPAYQIIRLPLHLEADEMVTITVRDLSGTLDPYIRLMDGDGRVIAINDDHQSTDLTLDVLDAQIRDLTLTITGNYTLEIIDVLGRAGQVHIAIQKVAITRP